MARKAAEEWRKAAERRAAESFGSWSADLRGSRLTQKQLAEQAGLSVALVSNVESGQRRATDDYLKRVNVVLKHDPGEWHLCEIRDLMHDEILLDAVVEQLRALTAQSTEIGDPQPQPLYTEALKLAKHIDVFHYVMREYLAAVGRGEEFDHRAARRAAEAENTAGTVERQVLEDESLRSHHQAAKPLGYKISPPSDDSVPERLELVDELLREIEHLSAVQLYRVLGFVAALPRTDRGKQRGN